MTRAVLCIAALALPGCYEATVRSGLPPSQTPARTFEHWQHAFVFGLLDASGPYRLDRLCPDGWAEVTVETSAAGGFLTLVTLGIYSPQNVTVVCALPGARGTHEWRYEGPPAEGPLP